MTNNFGPGSRNLKSAMTYWALSGAQTDYNEPGFLAPVLIYGRWQDMVQEVQKPDGTEFVSKAVCYLDQQVTVGGYLARGNLVGQANPMQTDAEASEIQSYGESPDLRNMSQEHRAYL
jgi:hypothetical protein